MLRTRTIFFAAVLLLVSLPPAHGEIPEEWREWNEPIEPFRIVGNLYYVGAREIAAYLFTTPDGHILLDGGFEETVPVIQASIEALGFKIEDVKWLLNSHAHIDHAGGLAALKVITGARLAASRGDAPLLTAGGVDTPYEFSPVTPDRLLTDGDTVILGGTTLMARVTPGHTPGCTTWTARIDEEGRSYNAVFVCSVNVLPGVELLTDDPLYPDGRAEAFARAFEILESLEVDYFLGPHASFFNMKDKLPELGSQGPSPFIDPDLYKRHVQKKKERFVRLLKEQQKQASGF